MTELAHNTPTLTNATRSAKSVTWRVNWDRQKFTHLDREVENLLGYPVESWNDLNDWADRIHHDDRIDVVNYCFHQAEAGRDHQAEYRARTASGDYVWLHYEAKVVREGDATKELVGFIFDISEQKLIEAATTGTTDTNRANNRLGQDDDQSVDFIRTISHDLKAPLSAINGYGELLRLTAGPKLDEASRSYVDAIMEGSERLIMLVDDLVTFARARDTSHNVEPVNLNTAWAAATANLSMEIDKSEAKISAEDLPTVAANHSQMMQVFQNIIQNSIKYRHPERRPMIMISAKRLGEYWQFAIDDNGRGIADEHLTSVFDIFHRTDPGDVIDGSGIGLATCKIVIEHYGGEIWVKSAPGAGSTFYFNLPVTDQ